MSERLAKILVLSAGSGVILLILGRIFSLPIKPLENFGELPPFAAHAVNAHTNTVSKTDLAGKPWVADFIFTNCGGPCPILSAHFARLQKILPEEAVLVSFTMDPSHDTPEVLKEYAERLDAMKNRWIFLRMGKRDLYDLLYAGFRVGISEDPEAPPEARITHSTKFILVDSQGRVRGYYDGSDTESIKRLEKDFQKLFKEKNNA